MVSLWKTVKRQVAKKINKKKRKSKFVFRLQNYYSFTLITKMSEENWRNEKSAFRLISIGHFISVISVT